ncbi:MAG: hypothetical protein NTY86_02705 [Deltaproteobacteria bacterium]|nr:hypothetical protein [Deltaproteobacteria bacterium]
MKMQEIRAIAKKWGVNIKVGRSKQDIIKDIQLRKVIRRVITQRMNARTIAYGKQIV